MTGENQERRASAHTALEQYAEWFMREKDRLLRYTRMRLNGEGDAESVLSKVLSRIGGGLNSGCLVLQDADREPYTLRAIMNETVTQLRNNVRRRRTESAYCDSGKKTEEPGDATTSAIRWAIGQLSPMDAHLITLHLWDELSFTSMSELMHVPAGTLRDRYNKALLQLEQVLKDNDLP
ncbi:MAG: hypothetical protein Q4A24_08270 [Akkermansia sp.]|nr:hypothetical protein [Akkermansia sp.]